MTKRVQANSPRTDKAFSWRSGEETRRLDYGRVYTVVREGAESAGQQFSTKEIRELKAIQEIVR